MTTITAVPRNDTAKRGRKPKPAEERVVKKTVSLKPGTYEGLVALGDGTLSKGIEAMYGDATKRRKRDRTTILVKEEVNEA